MADIGMAVEKVSAAGGWIGKKIEVIYVVAFFPEAFYDPALAIKFAKYDQPLMHGIAGKKIVSPIAKNLKKHGHVFQSPASEEGFGAETFPAMPNPPHDLWVPMRFQNRSSSSRLGSNHADPDDYKKGGANIPLSQF